MRELETPSRNGWRQRCLVLAWLLAAGCQTVTPSKPWNWLWPSAQEGPVLPDRILVVWSDTVLHQPGEPGLRGFGGRLLFYLGDRKDPVEVDGGLAVYVFDADKVDPHSPAPERKFVFSADQFASHMSHSELGRSYSVWLPWDEVGGPSRRLSIVTRFEGRHGGVVISQPTLKLLPGVSHEFSISTATRESGGQAVRDHDAGNERLQQVGYEHPESAELETATSGRKPSSRRRATETIDLPPSFYQRNLQTAPTVDQPAADDRPPAEMPSALRDVPRRSLPSPERLQQETAEDTPDQADDRSNRMLRGYPSRFPAGPTMKNRTLRREPFRAGWIESLPQTPRH